MSAVLNGIKATLNISHAWTKAAWNEQVNENSKIPAFVQKTASIVKTVALAILETVLSPILISGRLIHSYFFEKPEKSMFQKAMDTAQPYFKKAGIGLSVAAALVGVSIFK